MHGIPFLKDFVVILAAAVLVIYASSKIKVPSIVGFLLTGLLIGPYGLGLIESAREVELYAEIGVVMLLFSIGLEFSLDRLKQIRRAFFIGGSLQAVATILTTMGVVVAYGYTLEKGIFLGFLVTLSSTAIVLRLYTQRREIDAPQGKVVIGILLFQDFLAVIMIALTPVLGEGGSSTFDSIAWRFIQGLLVIVIVFSAARYIMPRVMYGIARTGIREILVISSLAICLGMALLTEQLNFSLALGAFLAGILISESEYSYQVVAEISPFRDVFNSLFFISIGMLLNLAFVLEHIPLVLLAGFGILVLKTVIVFLAVLALKFPTRIALITGISLAQIGEFSFVVLKIGQSVGLLEDTMYQTFLSSSILTMMITPLLVSMAPRLDPIIQRMLFRRSRTVLQQVDEGIRRLSGHVIVVGYGLSGQALSRVLRETGIGYIVVEINGETVRRANNDGENILYGDITRPDILELCGVRTASIIVFAISDALAVQYGIKLVKETNPSIHAIVRTGTVAEIEKLYKLGADEVIPSEMEVSIEIFVRVLQHYHVARNIINAQEKLLRGERYTVLRSKAKPVEVSEKILQWLAAGTTEVFLVQEGCRAVNTTLVDLDLRRNTGATIIAVVRGEQPLTDASPDSQIKAGDSLVLVGTHAAIEKAFSYLEAGPRVT